MNSFTSVFRGYVAAFLATLLSGLLVSVGLTEAKLRLHVLPNDSFTDYKRLFLHGTSTVAAFGDSHVASGLVNQPEIDNLGQASDTLITALEKAKVRAARGGLKLIILQADPQMFSAYRLKANQQDRISILSRENDPPLAMLRPEYRQYLMQFWWSAISGPLAVFSPLHQTEGAPEVSFHSRPLQEQRKEALLRVQLHAPIPNPQMTPLAQRYREAIEYFLHRGIRVCLVAFPVTSHYREATAGVASFGEAKLFFAETAMALGVPYLDYTDSLPDCSFGDSDHLLQEAADEFTHRVLRDCSAGKRLSP